MTPENPSSTKSIDISSFCNICDHQLGSRTSLDRHMRSSHDEVEVICLICSREYKNRWNGATHIKRVHSSEYVDMVAKFGNRADKISNNEWNRYL